MGAHFTLEPRLRALHAALTQEGFQGKEIETKDWTRIVIGTMGVMTRGSVQDITFGMDGLGLIGRPKRGVVVVNAASPDTETPMIPVELVA